MKDGPCSLVGPASSTGGGNHFQTTWNRAHLYVHLHAFATCYLFKEHWNPIFLNYSCLVKWWSFHHICACLIRLLLQPCCWHDFCTIKSPPFKVSSPRSLAFSLATFFCVFLNRPHRLLEGSETSPWRLDLVGSCPHHEVSTWPWLRVFIDESFSSNKWSQVDK